MASRQKGDRSMVEVVTIGAPGFGEWCWNLSVRAAGWRDTLSRFVDAELDVQVTSGVLVLPSARVQRLRASEWAVLWPELAGRIGVVLDWRGIQRASAWAPTAKSGAHIPLSGGAFIERTASTFVVRGAPSV